MARERQLTTIPAPPEASQPGPYEGSSSPPQAQPGPSEGSSRPPQVAQVASAGETAIMALLDSMAAREERRETSRIAWQTRQDERSARIESEQIRQNTVLSEHSEILKRIPEVEGKTREALKSYNSLQEYVNTDIRSHIEEQIQKANGPVLAALARQDVETAVREQGKREERERESRAAKRATERKDLWVKLATIGAPILVTLITVVGSVYVAFANQRAHEETVANLAAMRRDIQTGALSPASPGLPGLTLPSTFPNAAMVTVPSFPAAAPASSAPPPTQRAR
jgi:hypothetical protein